MVGFAPDGTGGRDTVPPFLYGVAGAASGAGTRVLSQPFDVLKIRLQVGIGFELFRNYMYLRYLHQAMLFCSAAVFCFKQFTNHIRWSCYTLPVYRELKNR